ncbi:MAG: competence protein ComEC family protein [Flavobacteriales bacterium]|nr:competence protein ComEC family protein [Flavobacteriales bacterium]
MLTAWKRSPMLRILLPFAWGLYVAPLKESHFAFHAIMLLVSLGMLTYWVIKRKAIKYRYRFVPPLMIACIFFQLGSWIVALQDPRLSDDHFSHTQQPLIYKLKLLDVPAKKDKSYKVIAEVMAVGDSMQQKKTSGKVLLYLGHSESARSLVADDVIILRGNAREIAPPINPNVFDYQRYLNDHGIFSQIYVDSTSWIKDAHQVEHTMTGYFRTFREYLLRQLSQHHIDERESEVLAALVLGKTAGLDEEIMTSYSGAGAVHVLAVSGLHVALIYMILAPLLKKIFRGHRARWFKTIVPVVLLWTYAGITGFSPSVLRSALMFTCFIISDNFQKQNNIFNTMSVSAMILLVFDPVMLREAGFQLSYLAVLGIVIYQDALVHLIYVKNKYLLWAWKLTCVSTAAQLTTLPITLYYFHQFPNYFILTNLIVIPLSTLVLYAGLIFFLLCKIPWLDHHLAHIAALLTRVMNELMITMSHWPGSVTKHIVLSSLEAWLVVMVVVFASQWILFRRTKNAIWTMACILLLLFNRIMELREISEQHVVCFHHHKEFICISEIQGKQCRVISNANLEEDERTQKFMLNGFHDHMGVESLDYLNISDSTDYSGICEVAGLKVIIPNAANHQALENFKWDLILFDRSSNTIFLDEDFFEAIQNSVVVFGGGFSEKKKMMIMANSSCPNCIDLSNGAMCLRLHQPTSGDDLHFIHFSEME